MMTLRLSSRDLSKSAVGIEDSGAAILVAARHADWQKRLAKNCRTSVEMVEKHYAVHLKNRLDASAINVRRAKPAKPKAKISPANLEDEE